MWTEMESPVGDLRIVEHDEAIVAIEFAPYPPVGRAPGIGGRADEHPVLVEARTQLAAYFRGERTTFDLPLRPVGTPFQQRVWEQLRLIGFGETTSYGLIAQRLGMTNAASRAVGLANGRNPIAVVIPCHRVIGANGKLVGYAGGLVRKQALLDLERSGADVLF